AAAISNRLTCPLARAMRLCLRVRGRAFHSVRVEPRGHVVKRASIPRDHCPGVLKRQLSKDAIGFGSEARDSVGRSDVAEPGRIMQCAQPDRYLATALGGTGRFS